MLTGQLRLHKPPHVSEFLYSLVTLVPMETHDSITAMAGTYAEKAVALAREFKAQLDYSENSLLELESILAQLAADMPAGRPRSGRSRYSSFDVASVETSNSFHRPANSVPRSFSRPSSVRTASRAAACA